MVETGAQNPDGGATSTEEIVVPLNGDGEDSLSPEIPANEAGLLTQREMVLKVLDRHGGSVGLYRHQIERFIQEEFGKSVPAQNVSTYLYRLKNKEHLVLSHDDRWFLREGSAR
jgi:hypothetical protein